MTKPVPHSSDTEIQALEAVCERLAGFRPEVSLEWVDGFMTALLAGPRTVLPSEWLPAMFEDAFERTFADPEDVAQAMQVLMARWNVIARQLDPEALIDEPDILRLAPLVLDDSPEARADLQAQGLTAEEIAELPRLGEVWAHGFMDALDAFPDDWPEPDLGTEAGRDCDELLLGISALTMDGDELDGFMQQRFPGKALSRTELLDEACFCVQDLRLYWVDHAPRHEPIRVAPKPGRNDPCPCGSGRKYKKCCGASL